MHIENVFIENFGPIARLQCHLEKDKINFIIGENGTGKTSFMAAIYAQLKKGDYITYDKNSNRIANVILTLKLKKASIEIHQKYEAGNHEMEIKKLTNFHEQIKELEELDIVTIKNLDMINIKDISSKKIINFLKRYEEKVSNKKLYETIMQKAQNIDGFHFISGGEQSILKIINILSDIEENTIVICDNVLERDSVDITRFILEIMHEMKENQFIIIRLDGTKDVIPESWFNNIRLQEPIRERNPVGIYGTQWEEYETKQKVKNEKHIYYKGEQLAEEESKSLEYKEIKGNNPCGSIAQNAGIYTVAFLNTKKLKKGCIKWGITDDRIVEGIILDKKQKDTIRKRICEELKEIKPYIGADDYEIRFENVFLKSGEKLEDTYVVELIIKIGSNNFLYATARDEVYMKTEAGKRKLNILEIQEEFAKRKKVNI